VAQIASELSATPALRPLPSRRAAPHGDDAAPKHAFSTLLDSADPAPEPPRRADAGDKSPAPTGRREDTPPPKAKADSNSTNADPKSQATGNPSADDADGAPISPKSLTIGDGKKADDAEPAKTADKAADSDDKDIVVADVPVADAAAPPDPTKPQTDTPPAVVLQAPPIVPAPAPVATPPELGGVAGIEAAENLTETEPAAAQGNTKAARGPASTKPQPAAAVPAAPLAADAAPAKEGAPGEAPPAGKSQPTAQPAAAVADASAPTPAKDSKITPDAAKSTGDAAGAIKITADAMQNLGVPTSASTTAASAPAAAAPAAAPTPTNTPPVPVAALAIEIATQAQAGKSHFDIRLDPPELGRINVRLEVDHDGAVRSHVTVDRAETLDLLKRDAPQLERALQQAGLKTGDSALQFSMRDPGFSRNDNPAPAPQTVKHILLPEDDPAPLEALRHGYGRLLGLGRGLDIRV
jgi:flagellar hook-length control protein FliK